MLTPDQINALEAAARKITGPITEYLLQDVTRRIAEAGQLTSTAQYQAWILQTLGLSQKKLEEKLRQLLRASQGEIRRILYQSARSGYSLDLRRFPTAEAIPFAENLVLQQIVSAAAELAEADFSNLTRTLGMVDPFGNALPLQKACRACTDFAFKQVITGAASYTEAVRQATRSLAEKGVRTIDYESGVHTSLEAAVRRSIMGGVGLLQEQVSQTVHDQLACDGWEITAHANSAPDHEPIQGKQYPDREYEALNGSLRRRIGTLNCGHTAFPVILGVNRPQHSKEELEKFRTDNQKGVTVEGRHYTGYEAAQTQRRLEGTIRKQKRRCLVDEAAGDDEKLSQDKTRLALLRQRYREFSRAAGLKTQYERTEIAGAEGKRKKTADSLLAAPQGNLVQEGEVFNPETAVDSLLKRLENSPGMKDNIAMIRYYAGHTDFVLDSKIDSPIAYDPNADVIRYNLSIPLPEGADRDGILAHELSHRADCLMYEASANPIWKKALEQTEKLIVGREREIESWFDADGKYEYDAFLSDIISAISYNGILVPFTHPTKDLEKGLIREQEVFANLSTITILGLPGAEELTSILKPLYDAFLEII